MNREYVLLGAYMGLILKVLFTAFALFGLGTVMLRYRRLINNQKYYFWIAAFTVPLAILWITGMTMALTGQMINLNTTQAYVLIFGGITPALAAGSVLGLLSRPTPVPC